MGTILLTGASGTVSSAVIRELRGSGHHLIGLVRDPASPKAAAIAELGVELRAGDLTKLRSIEGAFAGVDVTWLLAPPGLLAPAQMSNALWAARQGGVKHVVRMSAVGAAHDAPTINSRLHALSDGELAHAGIAYTIVKPHMFAQNIAMVLRGAAQDGVLRFALGDAKQPMIDVRDIASAVAAILANPAPHAGKTYTLTGPAAVGMADVAAALSAVLGKPITYAPIPVPAMIEMMAKFGADDYNQTALRDYLTAYGRGWQDAPTSAVQDLTGKPPRGIAETVELIAGGV